LNDTVDPAPSSAPYQQTTEYRWTEAAYDLLIGGALHGRAVSREGVVDTHMWGFCPRCGHQLDDRQTHTAVTNLMAGERHDAWGSLTVAVGRLTGKPTAATSQVPQVGVGDIRLFPVDVTCGCEAIHPGAPGAAMGCGASFRVELPLDYPEADDDHRPSSHAARTSTP
jgi:hypothetical protein